MATIGPNDTITSSTVIEADTIFGAGDMATQNITMTGQWIAVAGPGNCVVTPSRDTMSWAVGATTPSLTVAHALPEYKNTSFVLADGENLYIKGVNNADIAITRDSPPV